MDAASPGSIALRDAIAARGRIEGNLVKVDDFLNHQVDPALLDLVGETIASAWIGERPGLVLTAEASGIPPALTTARALGIAMVYAKKFPRETTERPAYVRQVRSPTKGAEYRVEVTRRMLPAGSRVLVVDDFLSGGHTAEALGEIVVEAGAVLLGFAFVVEKSFMEGRQRLEARGWRVTSVARVRSTSSVRDVEAGMHPVSPGRWP